MFEVNEDIQSLAEAFGERYFLQNAYREYEQCKHTGTKTLLAQSLKLHMVDRIIQTLPFYMLQGTINDQLAKRISTSFDQTVKDFLPHVNDSIYAFELFKNPTMHNVMSRDYVRFNAQTNMDDAYAAGPKF